LEEELKSMCEEWEIYYQEAFVQLKKRVEDINNQANLEKIEKLIGQTKEKDKALDDLTHEV